MAEENPLDPSPEHERRVRERAYFLWRADGCPEGREQEYWARAQDLQAIADSAGAGELPNPEVEDVARAANGEPVEEAEIMQNLGEFPDRLADQGERVTAPMTRTQRRRRSG